MAIAILNNIDQETNDAIEKIDLAQAGKGDPAKSGFFLNITLKSSFIEKQIRSIYTAEQVKLAEGYEETKVDNQKQRVLVDFSSPNIAKNMHVGHLRSTI